MLICLNFEIIRGVSLVLSGVFTGRNSAPKTKNMKWFKKTTTSAPAAEITGCGASGGAADSRTVQLLSLLPPKPCNEDCGEYSDSDDDDDVNDVTIRPKDDNTSDDDDDDINDKILSAPIHSISSGTNNVVVPRINEHPGK